MTIKEVLAALKRDEAVVVGDTTFEPRSVDAVTLETGETVYWARKGDGTWLSIDPASDEIILFEDLNEPVEPEDDTVVYGGADYEFSYEGGATVSGEEGDETVYHFREFESGSGEIIRITENESTGDAVASVGAKLTEDELQSA